MVNRQDLALARARVLLADIAPEIPEAEIVPEAELRGDLGLDVVSIWALAVGLEKMAKVEINDSHISTATTLASLLERALSDVPLEYADFGRSASNSGGCTRDDGAANDAGQDSATAGASRQGASGQAETGADTDVAGTDVVDDQSDGESANASPEDLQAALEDLASLFND